MKIKLLALCLSLLTFPGCATNENPKTDISKKMNDLNTIKQDFIASILQGEVNDSPFDMSYSLRTVFFSQDIISIFGEIDVYDHLAQSKESYEGKTYCKINDKFTPVSIGDIFSTPAQKEFFNQYCAKVIADGGQTLCGTLENDYLKSFVINESALIVILQPALEKCEEKTMLVSIPFDQIKEKWNPSSSLARLLPQVLKSKAYTNSWDDDQFFAAE